MKIFAITVALAAAVSAAPLSAQVARASTNQRVDCTYTHTTNIDGAIIYRRTSAPNCKDVPRVDGVWYQVGRGPDNNSIYVRRVLVDGKLIIQRARLNADGTTLTTFSSRPARNSDKAWKAEHKAWKKSEKAENKQIEAGYKAAGKEHKAAMKVNKGKDK